MGIPLLIYPEQRREHVKPRQAICPCCHSREFREHRGRTLCAYCRTEA